ncbi:hypothetical protein E3U36_10415 [Arsenophonus endosymbiont of Aphis craccivora]|uniref:hypothetical protein n=1 Tax=Arsenophonus endosymbiont of Aphis craccivora TaxID=1231049 RepID=UPI0015DD24B3|nr:hypothetical protein [Arsenophonus endosymbiont of Aphis craccivora]QLK88364.1 hypothetical protein E3U36_10415 [Arsenophonus endosymbiont of Aphis craccivora]
MPWGPDVETNLAISSANHLKVRFIQQSLLKFAAANYFYIRRASSKMFFINSCIKPICYKHVK